MMNERIRELAFQAMGINQKVSDDNFFVEVSKLKEFEKFAELIVNECADRLMQNDFKDFKSVVYIAGIRLKEHFGVEQ